MKHTTTIGHSAWVGLALICLVAPWGLGCSGTITCGEGAEACDGDFLHGQRSTCGNGIRDGQELCDGVDLGGKDCAGMFPGSSGALSCATHCGGFDTSSCTAPQTCNNGVLDPGETCDGAQLNGASCQSQGFKGGNLACASNCLGLETSGCHNKSDTCVPQCGDRQCGLDPVCNQPCGSCSGDSVCSDGQCKKSCDLPAFTQDATLDVNVTTVNLTGMLTLNGQPLPDNTKQASEQRGRLLFFHRPSNSYVEVPLGATGAFQYNVRLYPGTYDVAIHPHAGTSQNVLPDYRYTIRSNLEVKQSGTLNFDLKTVKLQGELKLNGATLPSVQTGASRGHLFFSQGASSLIFPLGPTGSVRYAVTLFAGQHTVSAKLQAPNLFPANETVLLPNANFQADGTYDFNLQTVKLSGKVTHNGATFAAGRVGQLRFVDVGNGQYESAELGTGGTYQVTLYSGTYDVQLAPYPSQAQSVFPTNRTLVAEGMSLSTDGTRNFDARTVTISGVVTHNGATLPDYGTDRGWLGFRDNRLGEMIKVYFGNKGPVSYTVKLFVGSYDLEVAPTTNWLPQTTHLVGSKVLFSSDRTHNVDLKTVQQTITLTRNGSPLPDNAKPNWRAKVYFVDATTRTRFPVEIGPTGPATFNVHLFAGRHNVELWPNSSVSQNVLPEHGHLLLEQADFSASGSRTIDVKTVRVSGAVTFDGAQLKDNTQGSAQRGQLFFVNRSLWSEQRVNLGTSGPAVYSVMLYATTYDLDLVPTSISDQNVWPGYRTKLRQGCMASIPCTASKSNLSGVWKLSTASAWRIVYLDLTQSGSSVSGSYELYNVSGPLLAGGTVNGDTVQVQGRPYNCLITFQGELRDGCTWVGNLDPVGACGGEGATPFWGQRLP